jgi:hypothetical protein
LSSQVSQVYYVSNERNPNWVVVVKTKPRDVYDVGEGHVDENDVDDYNDNEPSNLNIGGILEDIIDNLECDRNGIKGITLDTPEDLRDEIHHDESQDDLT